MCKRTASQGHFADEFKATCAQMSNLSKNVKKIRVGNSISTALAIGQSDFKKLCSSRKNPYQPHGRTPPWTVLSPAEKGEEGWA